MNPNINQYVSGAAGRGIKRLEIPSAMTDSKASEPTSKQSNSENQYFRDWRNNRILNAKDLQTSNRADNVAPNQLAYSSRASSV